MTTPVTTGESADYVDPFDDVFGSAPASPTSRDSAIVNQTGSNEEHRLQPSDPSDIPRLRSIHVTNGYREGIAASKEKYIQEGFDEGYALGAEIGLLAGWCLGALDGIWHSLPQDVHPLPTGASGGAFVSRSQMQDLRTRAASELTIQSLLSADFFGPDGIWLYKFSGGEEEGNVTFREVAKAHPTLKRWVLTIKDLAKAAAMDINLSST